MQKSQRNHCWTLLLFSSLIITFVVMVSVWCLVPREMHTGIWTWLTYNESSSSSSSIISSEPPTEKALEFFMPPETVPKKLDLKRGPLFIYQILH